MARRLILLAALIAISRGIALGQNAPAALLGNGSFEQGEAAPARWRLQTNGAWLKDRAHRGARFVHAESSDWTRAGQSNSIQLSSGGDYRLEGWIRCRQGEARIGLDLLDANARAVKTVESPRVAQADDWRYVAVEFHADALSVVVWLGSRGDADFDDVALANVATSYLGNRDVQPDAKGRIGFWGEEPNEKVAAGKRGGAHRSDPDARRRDVASLRLEATEDWYALSSVAYGVPASTRQIELSCWARTEGQARAQILACWMDDTQQILRVDPGPETTGTNWEPLKLAPENPPADAHAVKLVALVRGGHAWFDDFNLRHLRAREKVVRVFANQVGYELEGPKNAVVATNFFPAEMTSIQLRIVGKDDQPAIEKEIVCSGRIHAGRDDDWGWYFWRADFSELRTAGTFRAMARVEEVSGQSHSFGVERGVILRRTAQNAVDFFFVQRCGCEVSGWHGACHLDDAQLPDGSHLNVTGGWHSAGDYNKPMWQFGDSGASYALASASAAHPREFGRFDRDKIAPADALDEALWGAKFLAKMQNPSDGTMRGDVLQGPGRSWMKWSAPEEHTDNKIGTADDPVIAAGVSNVPLTVAAWAALARTSSDAELRRDFTTRAERLWTALATSETAMTNPLLLIGALELHRTTAKDPYKSFARGAAEKILGQQRDNGSFPGDSGDHGDVAAAALAMFALQLHDDSLNDGLRMALLKYLEFCLSRSDNPFGLSRQGVETSDPAFFHPSVGLGVNFWILSRAWAALLIHQLTRDPRALVYATDQVDWVLGKNSLDLCMMEGLGAVNPPRYHHRYNMIPGRERGAVPGAIPNGMVRDMGLADRPGFDLSRAGGRSPSFRTSEPWLVHNMFFLLAASALETSVNAE
jgi:hypothetical protein